MNSPYIKLPLPVPDIPETSLSYSKKKATRKSGSIHLKPPRLYSKHDLSLNRSINSSTPHAISFRGGGGDAYDSSFRLSPIFDKEKSQISYYEQCFEQVDKIGEGSFGEVFKVKSREDGRLYAVKMSKQYFRSEGYRQERLEEVRRYEQFSEHENCVTLHKAWEQDDRLFMQMELCECSMEDFARDYAAKNKNLPESEVWSFLLDLLLALKGLHDQNLIHLDIKLDNVLITEDGVCKLADFGLVFDLNQDTRNAIEGDSRYIAPEVLHGKFSKAADIFSLGVCVLELAGNIELESNGPLWQQLRLGVLPNEYLQRFSPDLREIIQWMMEPQPEKRPSVDTLLQHPKISSLFKSRRRFSMLRTMRTWTKRCWRKLCNLKTILFQWILLLVSALKLKSTKSDENSKCSATPNLFVDEDEDLQCTPRIHARVPKSTPLARIVNSTPLNTNGLNFRKNRKEFSRTHLEFESSDDEYSLSHSHSSNDFQALESGSNDSGSLCRNLSDRPNDSTN